MGAKQSGHVSNGFIHVNSETRSEFDDSYQKDPRLNKTWNGTEARSLMETEEENHDLGNAGMPEKNCNLKTTESVSKNKVFQQCELVAGSNAPRSINLATILNQQQQQGKVESSTNHAVSSSAKARPDVLGDGDDKFTIRRPVVSSEPRIESSEVTVFGGEDRSMWTTRMVRNLPNDYRRHDVLDMLDSMGVKYDFIYLPMDWGRRANLGYAFVNLISPEEAVRCETVLTGYSGWRTSSEKLCEVVWGKEDQQSLRANVERFRNSPVMHPDVPEEFKPLIFTLGKRTPFPAPTKRIRPPREFQRKSASTASAAA